MQTRKEYIGINSIETVITHPGKYGAKGEKRAKRKKATSEQIKRQNQINRENYVRRLINKNFYPNDLWVTLKYPKGTRKPYYVVKKDFDNFIKRLRREYGKRCEELKYIYRIEIGSQGGIHIHLLLNRIEAADLLVQKQWGNLLNFTPLYSDGDFKKLASYLTKPVVEEVTDEAYKQLELFEHVNDEDIKKMAKYNPSRNLVKPEPVTKEYKRKTVKKIVDEGPVARPGYYIEKDSVYIGINQYTGMSYICYTEIRLQTQYREIKKRE